PHSPGPDGRSQRRPQHGQLRQGKAVLHRVERAVLAAEPPGTLRAGGPLVLQHRGSPPFVTQRRKGGAPTAGQLAALRPACPTAVSSRSTRLQIARWHLI